VKQARDPATSPDLLEGAFAAALLPALVDVVGAVVACDADGSVVLVSRQARELLGPLDEARSDTVDTLLLQDVAGFVEDRRGPLTAALGGIGSRVVASVVTPAGHGTTVSADAQPLDAPDGCRVGALLTLRQEERPVATIDTTALGLHDPLTGLPNRRLLGDRIDRAIARTRREGGTFAVLMIDLDRFKQINDEHGHEHGDRVLREVGARLAHTVRPDDTIARFGGDEFVAVCEAINSDADLELITERLLSAAAAPIRSHDVRVSVGASIGVARAGPDDDPETLLHEADLAMYEAKRRGRNTWTRFDDELARSAHRHAHLVSELRRAIAAGDLEVAYQPEVDLQRGGVAGYEALVRWYHPDLGPVRPDELIAAAEQSDLIASLGALVLDRACTQAARWPVTDGRGAPSISVNVSARELADPDLADRVLEVLARRGLPGTRLCLELTESSLIEGAAAAEARLNRLHAAGVRLAIDDFGTGFASLTYLQRLPVQQVKIDRSFVQHLPASHEDDVIVTSVLNLAHNLDLTVVAEGIETEAQLRFLRTLGCDMGQGYLLGRPSPADELLPGAVHAGRKARP
jgi:diguanylate cyclase (GGDEF)-like protein